MTVACAMRKKAALYHYAKMLNKHTAVLHVTSESAIFLLDDVHIVPVVTELAVSSTIIYMKPND